jgi:hypothetical protein
MEENKELEKEPVIGEFKPKRRFINFVSAVSGAKVRLLRDVAYINASKLSGMLEGVKLKVTICDEGTINLEEVSETNQTDKEMLVRLLDEIDSRDVTGYAQKFVVSGLEFKDEDGSRCYLEVEHEKPVERFRSILDSINEENDTIQSASQSLSEKGKSFLDSLFSDDEVDEVDEWDEDHAHDLVLNNIISEFTEEELDEIVKDSKILESEADAEVFFEAIENPSEPNEKLKSAAKSYLEESFLKMNEEKINELKTRIEDSKRDISKYEYESKVAEKKVTELKDNLKVLNSRLEQMYPGDDTNGYVFFVSEEQKMDTTLTDNDKELVSKISKLMGLKEQALFEHLTEGFYNIKIAKSDDIENQDFELEKEILEKVNSIDIDGKISIKDGQFEYRGELNWHQLVQKMIRLGFEQNPEFDKLCNSNSYESKWSPKSESESDQEEVKTEILNENKEFNSEEFLTIDEPTDLVFVGTGHGDIEKFNPIEKLSITDDFVELDTYINGSKIKRRYGYECDGFFTIMKLSDYKEWYNHQLEEYGIDEGGCSGFIIPNFKGVIKVGSEFEDKNENIVYVKDIDFSDYINHQYDETYGAFFDFPEGTQIFDLNDDLSLPTAILRDIKIDNVLNNDN